MSMKSWLGFVLTNINMKAEEMAMVDGQAASGTTKAQAQRGERSPFGVSVAVSLWASGDSKHHHLAREILFPRQEQMPSLYGPRPCLFYPRGS